MAASEENSALFPIFILTIMALPLVPYTIHRLFHAASKKTKSIHCPCAVCLRSGKYRKSIFKRISNFSTYSNLTVVLLWIVMVGLVYYIKHVNHEVQVFEPFSILGLEPGASDSEIRKAFRKLSILYHPDKNPDPEAHKYFVEYISKAHQALTDPISRENFEKYGHPDGRQGLQMGIALPQFLLNIDGASGGVLLLGIVGVCILLPLIMAVIYLSRSSKYSGNYVMHHTVKTYYYFMKPSLAPSKVMDVFIKAAEFMEIPVRRSDGEPLQKLFLLVRSELNLDLKNIKQEQAKFWKQHPSLVKAELLIQAQLTRESGELSPALLRDLRRMLELAPRLLEELMKMAIIPHTSQGHGWLRPAIGVVELSQSIVQAVPLSARKASGGSTEGVAPFLQLPHFSEAVVKKIARKKVRSFEDLRDMTPRERADLLTQVAGFSPAESEDVETVLEMMPTITMEITCKTEGEEEIQEGDIATMQAWVTLKRGNGLTVALPHAPYFPFQKDATEKDRTQSEALRESEGMISKFRSEAAKRLRELEKAEEAADAAIFRFGANIGNFLKEAVTVAGPETTESQGSGGKVLFESRDVDGKRVIHSTRFEAQLHAVHSSLESFTKDPESTEYAEWKNNFNIDSKTAAIAKDLEKYTELRASMEKLVPEKVEYSVFWTRYYFLRMVVETEEERRREILKGAAKTAADETIAWDDDSDDDNEQSSTPRKPQQHQQPVGIKLDDQTQDTPESSTTLHPRDTTPTTTTPAASSSNNASLKPTADSRRSEDGKSQADSDASYDLVSGATSRAPGSPKEGRVKKEEGPEAEEDEEDWE